MSNLIVEIKQVNETENYLIEKEFCESAYSNTGSLYRGCLKSFGKCGGKIYVDRPAKNGNLKPVAVGWWFEKLEQYSDSKEKFKCVTWITLLEDFPIQQPPLVKFKQI